MMKVIPVLLLIAVGVCLIDAHGRIMKPASRSSLWRVPEFAHLNPTPNWDDNQLYCGGLHQAEDPGTNCGICGDPFSSPSPRANEIGGTYYKGIISGNYQAGQTIDVEIDLTTSHLGAMEFRLCTNPQDESQNCFNQHVLQLQQGGTKLPAGPTGMMYTKIVLPQGVRCEHCVLQWNYRAGNGWGDCGNGTSAGGCGPQETFRHCSDIKIN